MNETIDALVLEIAWNVVLLITPALALLSAVTGLVVGIG